MTSLSKTASWVIVSKQSKKAVLEVFDYHLVQKINTRQYEAIPILKYLQTFNKEVKQ